MSNWDDLRMRLAVANDTLLRMRRASADEAERDRLDAKASGVRLALSYMDDYRAQIDRPSFSLRHSLALHFYSKSRLSIFDWHELSAEAHLGFYDDADAVLAVIARAQETP